MEQLLNPNLIAEKYITETDSKIANIIEKNSNLESLYSNKINIITKELNDKNNSLSRLQNELSRLNEIIKSGTNIEVQKIKIVGASNRVHPNLRAGVSIISEKFELIGGNSYLAFLDNIRFVSKETPFGIEIRNFDNDLADSEIIVTLNDYYISDEIINNVAEREFRFNTIITNMENDISFNCYLCLNSPRLIPYYEFDTEAYLYIIKINEKYI